ncbi:MAG: Maf family protein [Planctomycetota bacterium]|jgi:septum formation protein
MKHQSPRLILASSSPRRKELLQEAGYKFTVKMPNVDEAAFAKANFTPVEHAEQLALAKANSIAEDCPDALIIGADTVVDLKGQVIGKPKDTEDARRILKKLSASAHKVITGLALICSSNNIKIVKSEITTIYPRKMTDNQINKVIKSGVWQNKSGACSIEDFGEFVEKTEGSLTNVMGLPMELLQKTLKEIKYQKN